MIGWFRVPAWIGGRRQGDRPATESEAWVDLLGRWHQGEDISACGLADALQWGKGRTLALMPKVAAWAKENGATLPASWAARVPDRSADQQRTDMRTGPSKEEAAQTTSGGPESDRAADQDRTASRARVPSSEKRADPDQTRPEIRNVNVPPPPPAVGAPAPLFAQPPAAAPEPAPPPKPEPKPKAPPSAAQLADEQAIWAAWKMFRKGGATAPPKLATAIRSVLKTHPAEEVVKVIRWAYQSTHSRARFLRGGAEPGQINAEGAYGLDTLLRHLDDYAALMQEQAEAPAPAPRPSALPPGVSPRAVVIDAVSGWVEEEARPRQPAAQGGKRDNLSLATMFYSEIVNAPEEEEEAHEA